MPFDLTTTPELFSFCDASDCIRVQGSPSTVRLAIVVAGAVAIAWLLSRR